MSLWSEIQKLFLGTIERPSPSDIFKDAYCLWQAGNFYRETTSPYDYRVKKEVLNIPFTEDPIVFPSVIPNTNSMDPVFDSGHHNLYIKGSNDSEQTILINWLAEEWSQKKMANIIVYRIPTAYAVHRLTGIQVDSTGKRRWYFKGDNNPHSDSGQIYDENIEYVGAGTLY